MKRKNEEVSTGAKRMRIQRRNESLDEKKTRLKKNRIRNQTNRKHETKNRKKRRMIARQKLDSIRRVTESSLSKKTRKERNNLCQKKRRAKYTSEQKSSIQRAKRLITKNTETNEKEQKRKIKENKKKREKRVNKTNGNLYRAAFNYDPKKNYSKEKKIQIGEMNIVCLHCKALKFPHEPAGMCCSNGKLELPTLNDPPNPLFDLVNGNSKESKHFNQNFITYNNIFKMTSFGATKLMNKGTYLPTFKIQGNKSNIN